MQYVNAFEACVARGDVLKVIGAKVIVADGDVVRVDGGKLLEVVVARTAGSVYDALPAAEISGTRAKLLQMLITAELAYA